MAGMIWLASRWGNSWTSPTGEQGQWKEEEGRQERRKWDAAFFWQPNYYFLYFPRRTLPRVLCILHTTLYFPKRWKMQNKMGGNLKQKNQKMSGGQFLVGGQTFLGYYYFLWFKCINEKHKKSVGGRSSSQTLAETGCTQLLLQLK